MYSTEDYYEEGDREDAHLPRKYLYCSLLELKKYFLRILLGIYYRKHKYAPKVWQGKNFSNFKQQTEAWLDGATLNLKVGGE